MNKVPLTDEECELLVNAARSAENALKKRKQPDLAKEYGRLADKLFGFVWTDEPERREVLGRITKGD